MLLFLRHLKLNNVCRIMNTRTKSRKNKNTSANNKISDSDVNNDDLSTERITTKRSKSRRDEDTCSVIKKLSPEIKIVHPTADDDETFNHEPPTGRTRTKRSKSKKDEDTFTATKKSSPEIKIIHFPADDDIINKDIDDPSVDRLMAKRSKSKKDEDTSTGTKKSSPDIEIVHLSTDDDNDETIDNEVTDKDAAKYFVAEILEPPNKAAKKKRKSIEITYELFKESENGENPENSEGKDGEQWYPENFKESWDLISEMRKHHTAPVDDQGCHMCADSKAKPETIRYQTLVALMLSSQTKDQVNHAAMARLKKHGCTPQNLVNTSDDILGKLIYPVSFWKRKVQYIKKASGILIEEHDGDIPKTIEGLCALPGVGPKMGHLCMQVAWNEVTGIGVDTHVHRICNRLKWVKKFAKTPEETRKQLESWLPKELWTEINYLLVGFGQEICQPQRPKCDVCLNNKLCPFAKFNNNNKKK